MKPATRLLVACSLSAFFWTAATTSQAAASYQEWPQIQGVERDSHATDTKLDESWPADGPPTLWTYEVGYGYAGPAIAAGKAFVFHRIQDQVHLDALNVDSGERLWRASFDTDYRASIDPDTGPRCVPLVHENIVFVYGAEGNLHAVDATNGKTRWTRTLGKDLRASEGFFGAGSTPIVAADKLILNTGGRPDASIVAIDPQTGKTLWKSFTDEASYSTPLPITFGGQDALVFATRLHIVVISPNDGSVLYQSEFGRSGPTVTAATPVRCGDRLFFSSSYGVGARLAKIDNNQLTTVWENDSSLSSQYTTAVYRLGYLYGTHGREDYRNGELRCVDVTDGSVKWSEPSVGVAHVLLCDDRLVVLTVEGELLMVDATPQSYRELARIKLFQDGSRALPALVQGRLFARSNASRTTVERPDGTQESRWLGELRCLKIGTAK